MATTGYAGFRGLSPVSPRNLNDSPKPTMQTAAPDRPGELLAWAASCTGVHGVGGVKKSGRPFWKPTRSSNFYVRKFREGGYSACTMVHAEPADWWRPGAALLVPVSAQNHTSNQPARWPPGATPGGPSWGGFSCPHAFTLAGAFCRGHETPDAPTFRNHAPKGAPMCPRNVAHFPGPYCTPNRGFS